MTDTTISLDSEQLTLLGHALISVQRLDYALYLSIKSLCKHHSSDKVQAIANVAPSQFLQGTTVELKPTLQLLDESFADTLPLSTGELSDFIFKRNLITNNFWLATATSVKGSEKLANPKLFLQQLVEQCDAWLAKVEE